MVGIQGRHALQTSDALEAASGQLGPVLRWSSKCTCAAVGRCRRSRACVAAVVNVAAFPSTTVSASAAHRHRQRIFVRDPRRRPRPRRLHRHSPPRDSHRPGVTVSSSSSRVSSRAFSVGIGATVVAAGNLTVPYGVAV